MDLIQNKRRTGRLKLTFETFELFAVHSSILKIRKFLVYF